MLSEERACNIRSPKLQKGAGREVELCGLEKQKAELKFQILHLLKGLLTLATHSNHLGIFFFLIPMLGPTSDKINQNLQENSMISAFLKTPSDHAISISYGNLDK